MSLRPGSSASTTGWSGACARSGVTGNVRIPISNLISALIAGRALGPLGGQLQAPAMRHHIGATMSSSWNIAPW